MYPLAPTGVGTRVMVGGYVGATPPRLGVGGLVGGRGKEGTGGVMVGLAVGGRGVGDVTPTHTAHTCSNLPWVKHGSLVRPSVRALTWNEQEVLLRQVRAT